MSPRIIDSNSRDSSHLLKKQKTKTQKLIFHKCYLIISISVGKDVALNFLVTFFFYSPTFLQNSHNIQILYVTRLATKNSSSSRISEELQQ